jgi:predicted GIY-YIG superfamily endonuclease
MIELVDKFDMISLIPERRHRFSEKESNVKKDGRHKKIVKIVLQANTIVNIPMENLRKIEDCCGVYVFITRSGKTYIGSSQNIIKRIVNHRRKYLFDLIEEIIICTTEDVESARKLEKTLIKNIKPDLNTLNYDPVYNKKYTVINLFKVLFRYSKN